jgi:serine/threonine-protein kinase
VAIAAGIMVGVLRGLHAAHEATNHDGRPLEIVHCDISPQNIMVGADGVARIIDFGVARSILQSRRDVDSSEEFAERPRGKRSYLSPEQIRGKSLDRRSDLFSSAIVLWELLAGRRLFQGPSRRAVWMQILLGQSAPPSSLNPEVSRELDDAVLCALDCDRERRFPTAEAFADRLAEVTSAAFTPKVCTGSLVPGYIPAGSVTR